MGVSSSGWGSGRRFCARRGSGALGVRSLKRAHPDVSQGSGGGPSSETQGPGQLHFGPDGNLAASRGDVHDLVAVNPRLDRGGCDSQPDAIPPAFLEVQVTGGFIVSGVFTVEAGQPHHAAAPAANDQAAWIFAHRKSEAAEKITAVNTHCLQLNFVIHTRN